VLVVFEQIEYLLKVAAMQYFIAHLMFECLWHSKKYLSAITDATQQAEVCRIMACSNCQMAESSLISDAVNFCITVCFTSFQMRFIFRQ